MKSHSRCVRKLLEVPGINVDCKDDQGQTLLTIETKNFFPDFNDKLEKIEFWIEKGSDVNACDVKGDTVLHYCAKNHES